MRKGQTINIDWSTGLALFLVTILSSVIFLIDPLALQNQNALENRATQVQEDLQREAGRTNHRNNFYTRAPYIIENVPFDRRYYYRTMLGLGVGEKPSEIDIPENRFSTVLDTGNSSMEITYFRGDFEPPSYYSDLEAGSGTIGNSKISIQYSSNVDSATINGREAIQSIKIDGSTDTSQNDIYAEVFSGNLKVFNSSREFIVEDESFEVRTKNYSTLYWYPEGEQSLAGIGTIREGRTSGFTLADSDLGVTFTGNLTANISKPDSSTIVANIEAPRTRIRIHESGTGYGEKRIRSYVEGRAFFGAETVHKSLFRSDLEALSNMTEREFETRFGLVNWGYNLTVTLEDGNKRLLSRGQPIAFRDTSVSTRQMEFISESGEIKRAKSKVVLWR